MRRQGRCLSIGQLGLCGCQSHLVIPGVDLHQHRPGLYVLVLLDVDLLHGAAHLRADGHNVAIDLGIVGGLASGEIPPEAESADCEENHGGQDKPSHPRVPGERAPGGGACGPFFRLVLAGNPSRFRLSFSDVRHQQLPPVNHLKFFRRSGGRI